MKIKMIVIPVSRTAAVLFVPVTTMAPAAKLVAAEKKLFPHFYANLLSKNEAVADGAVAAVQQQTAASQTPHDLFVPAANVFAPAQTAVAAGFSKSVAPTLRQEQMKIPHAHVRLSQTAVMVAVAAAFVVVVVITATSSHFDC